MDVVEAIDAWIDEQIDELNDDELEWVLELLDAVAVSRFAQHELSEMSSRDVVDLADFAGASNGSRIQVEAILRAAILGASVDLDAVFADEPYAIASDSTAVDLDVENVSGPFHAFPGDDDDAVPSRPFGIATDIGDSQLTEPSRWNDTLDDEHWDEQKPSAGVGRSALFAADTAQQSAMFRAAYPDEQLDDLVETDPDPDGDEPDDEDSLLVVGGEERESLFRPLETSPDDDFLTDLAHAERTDEVAAVRIAAEAALPQWAMAVPSVPLIAHDELGPSFLPEVDEPAPGGGIGARHVVLPLLLIGGLVLFGFGMLRLIDSLDAGDDVTAPDTTATTPAPTSAAPTPAPTETLATAEPEPTTDPAAATAATAADESVDGATSPPLGRLALRLVTGEVVLLAEDEASGAAAGPPTVTTLYEVDDDQPPARHLTWGDFGVAIADNSGNVVVVDPDDVQDPRLVFEADDEMGEAVELAAIPGRVVVLTDLGMIVLADTVPDADPADVEMIWDATPALATAIGAVGDLVPFLIDTGDARLLPTGSDGSAITIWLSGAEPPALALEGLDDSVLLGIGEGTIVRYRVGDIDGDRVETVWEPATSDRQPAISFTNLGDDVALVLVDGSVVLADSSASDEPLWDSTQTEIRAFVLAGDEAQLTLLLEIGSIVRILRGEESAIESVWDITDQTRAPANQFAADPGVVRIGSFLADAVRAEHVHDPGKPAIAAAAVQSSERSCTSRCSSSRTASVDRAANSSVAAPPSCS